jgi:hypothetical protein
MYIYNLHDEIYRHPIESLHQVRQLFELLEKEGIRDIRLPKACFIAFQIAVVVGDKARAKVFAERAYAARKLLSGEDNLTTITFQQLAERPVEHPLYSAGMRCYDDSWEPPQEMGREELDNWLWNPDGWLKY